MELSERVEVFFGELQDRVCRGIEALDGSARFHEDRWAYAPDEGGSGGGVTRVMRDGAVFEKGGVNRSTVEGRLSERLAGRLGVPAQRFAAGGVSLVLHPENPHVPTAHMNVRFIRLLGHEEGHRGRAWFGGGADLTPCYLYEDDAVHFHRQLREACDSHDPAWYPRFKTACDEYFRLPHRDEARGVGGVFFDHLEDDLEGTFRFVRDFGNAFLGAYSPVVERRRGKSWTADQRHWQLVRRGRYVEFNLVHDRGTLFGLETGGRTESILMSLPPLVRWDYDHRPREGSPEAALLEVLRTPRDWLR